MKESRFVSEERRARLSRAAELKALRAERKRLRAALRAEEALRALRQECDRLRAALDGADAVHVTADRIGPVCHNGPPDYVPYLPSGGWAHPQDCPQP